MNQSKKQRKTTWVCQECGHREPRHTGFCPSCRKYGTMVEEVEAAPMFRRGLGGESAAPRTTSGEPRAQRLGDVAIESVARIGTGVPELDRVLGGGIVPGSLVLVGGDPGIGKSTLLMQMAGRLEKQAGVLYVTGEESLAQIALRAERLNLRAETVWTLCETRLETIIEELERIRPKVAILDSIQTVYREDLESAPGSVSQLRECAAALLTWAKTTHTALFLIGHVTKEGQLAGPRVLEHMVDTVLYFEGDRHHMFRVLRAVKNRFGASGEIGVFEMRSEGLRGVENPSALFVEGHERGLPGSAVTASVEGSRPLLCEVQALAGPTHYSMPQRVATGIDARRLTILLALLERHGGMQLAGYDVFVSVAGGLKLDDPGCDLAVAAAVASSVRNRAIAPRTLVLGELGLGGELRSASQLEARLKEAAQLGFERAILPAPTRGGLPKSKLKLVPATDLYQALEALLA